MLRLCLAALCALLGLVLSANGARAEGALRARSHDGRELGNFPLTHTDVRMEIAGGVIGSTVTQRFRNAFTEPIEAVYVFPLPDDAAVDHLEMRIGQRTVRAEIARRDEARQRYQQARDEGRRAALLEQERPNIFTFSVANIDPGAAIDVTLHYFARARYDHGRWEMAFPMVVGPRYIPGMPTAVPSTGTGRHPDTDRVPDGSRISPEYVPPGTRAGHDIALAVRLDAGARLVDLGSSTHAVVIARDGDRSAAVSLRDEGEIPNRDFVLHWTTSDVTLQTALITHRPDITRPGYFSLSLEARRDVPEAEITPRELVFLLDTSGSMQGEPLNAVKWAVEHALRRMHPRDTFTIIDFADTASAFSPRPVSNTPAHVTRALAYLAGLSASGGTNQLAGIHAALSLPGESGRLRNVVFMTDGYIGNESEVLGLTRREIGRARIFSFGVGSSVNRYLLDEVALAGRGHAEFLRNGEDPAPTVERLYRRMGRPWLTDLRVEWEGVDVVEQQPHALPDVSALQPLSVFGRYLRGGSGTAVIRGTIGDHTFEQRVSVAFPDREERNAAIASVWARERIGELERSVHVEGDSPALTGRITDLALGHHLVSRFTSLVAVDRSPPAANTGRPRTVNQPLDGPEGHPLDGPEGVNLGTAGGAIVGGNMTGGQVGDAFGYGGLGASGSGWGGGGTGQGTIGLGSLGASGHGAGSGSGAGYGTGAGRGLRSHFVSAPLIRPSPPQVTGMMSPEVIRRVVLRNIGQVNRCYEQALVGAPTLAGRVVLRFVVGTEGRVIGVMVAQSNITSEPMHQCLMAAVRRWVFPAPEGGRVITISYPFVFTPAEPPPRQRR